MRPPARGADIDFVRVWLGRRAAEADDLPAPASTRARRRDTRASSPRGGTFMGVQVVTIAMTTGARAEQVGRLVAERLGFQYINDEIIDRAAEHAGVSRREVAEVERSPSLISRIITAIGSGPLNEYGTGLLAADEIDASPSYRRLIQEVIREVPAQGNVVILAHGASILLAGAPGLLRVLVTASPATRADRLIVECGQDERQATREI